VDSFVYHMYNNSWKKDHFSVGNQKRAARQQQQLRKRQEAMRKGVLVLAGVSVVVYGVYIIMAPLVGGASRTALLLPVASKGGGGKRAD
jgi:hypothetical protein